MRLFTILVLGLVAVAACGPGSHNPGDDTVFDDAGPTPVIDAFGGSKFGEECTTSDDCQPDGYCVEGSGHDVCTYPCAAGCPDGWNCRATDVAGALVSSANGGATTSTRSNGSSLAASWSMAKRWRKG